MPENVLRLMERYPQPMRRQPSVEYLPLPYRSNRGAAPEQGDESPLYRDRDSEQGCSFALRLEFLILHRCWNKGEPSGREIGIAAAKRPAQAANDREPAPQ